MLALLAGALYLSFICWTAGQMLLQLMKNTLQEYTLTTCLLAGLCFYCFAAGCWTLLLPTSNDAQHIVICTGTLAYWFVKKPRLALIPQLYFLRRLSLPESLLLAVCGAALLIMAAWRITHPDTLGYHADIIAWIDGYKIIPGLANLQLRLGYGGQWYPLCSFFSIHHINVPQTNMLNLTVALWFILFVGERLAVQQNLLPKFVWVFLLVIAWACYTQLRLTVTSASPDFIAGMMAWWVVYSLMWNKGVFANYYLILIVCITAITIKLSVVLIGLVVLIPIFKNTLFESRRIFLKTALLALLIISPFLVRNLITTGYLLFPVPQTAINRLPWMVPEDAAAFDKAYITAYAKAKVVREPEAVAAVNNRQLQEWLPEWWGLQSTADKVLLTGTFLSVFFTFTLLFTKRFWNSGKALYWMAIMPGIGFWATQAPDPRFGYGYLIPALFFPFTFFKIKKETPVYNIAYNLLLVAMLCGTTAYLIYRAYNFLDGRQIIVPAGIAKPELKTVSCHGLIWNTPVDKNAGCRGAVVPCLPQPCNNVRMISSTIGQGFKP